jgi:ATP-binding cassette subfamily B protein
VFEVVRARFALLTRLPWIGGGLLAALTGLTLLAGVVPAATALAVGRLVGALTDAASADLVSVAVAPLSAYAMMVVIGHAVAAVRGPLSYLAEARINGRHRAELSRMAASSPTIGALDRPRVQALIRTARADPQSFMDGTPGAGALAQLDLIGRALALVGAALVLAASTWWSVLLLVAAAVAVHQLNWDEGRRRRRVWREVPAHTMRADVWSDAFTSSAEGKEIRVFGLADWALDRVDGHLRSAYDPLWPVSRGILARQWRQLVLVLVPLGIVYVVVAVDAARGGAPVAVAAAALVAGMSVFTAFDDPPHATTCLRAFRELQAELGMMGEPLRPSESHTVAGRSPRVRFENVGFAYPGTDSTVLDGLDLEIRPGELLAIVGVNGAGKSTLIKLLSGLYEPTSGRITADGTDLTDIGPAWRQSISVVFQDFVRYHLPAADNVTLGNAFAAPDLAAVEAAARDAGFDDVVRGLPDGWSTPLARTRTGGWADLILVLHQGRLVEQGTHDELLAADGRYATLYGIQATAYRVA